MTWGDGETSVSARGGHRALFGAGVLVLAVAIGVGVRPSPRADAKPDAPRRAPDPARMTGAPKPTTPAKTPPASPPPVELTLDPDASAPPARAAPDGGSESGDHARGRRHRRDRDEMLGFSADDPESYRRVGQSYEADGQLGEAVTAYRRYLELAPRARDRQRIARHVFDLTHAADGALK